MSAFILPYLLASLGFLLIWARLGRLYSTFGLVLLVLGTLIGSVELLRYAGVDI